MSEKLNNKTSDQCKKFFYENRKKFQLDKLVLEYKRVSLSSALEIVSYKFIRVRDGSQTGEFLLMSLVLQLF